MRLEKRVKAPACNVSQVDGCRAGPSESPCIVHQTAQRGKVTVYTFERAVWEAGGDKRLANVFCSARSAAAAIDTEATAADRRESLVARHIQPYAAHHRAAVLKSDASCARLHAAQTISSTVSR